MSKDHIRQALNLILGSIMWLCSSLNLFFDGARSPAEMSDANDSLLVPYGIAFSIWLPIFVFCFGYGVLQALPKNRERALYRRIGWWSAAGFGGVCLWGIVNAYAPIPPQTAFDWALWGTALIFVPTMLCLVKAMLIATAEKPNMSRAERYTAWLGLSLIAGWSSLAVFLNWTPQIVSAAEGLNIIPSWTCAALVCVICGWVWYIGIKSNGNGAYVFPVFWGFTFVVVSLFTEKMHLEHDILRAVIVPAPIISFGVLLRKKYTKPVTTRIFSRS